MMEMPGGEREDAPAVPTSTDIRQASSTATATLTELQAHGDIVMDFTKEFNKVWMALTESHEREAALVSRCKGFLSDIDSNKSSAVTAQTEAKELESTKQHLVKELGKLSTDVQKATVRLGEKQTDAESKRAIIAAATETLDKGSGWTKDQAQIRKELEEKERELRVSAEAKRDNMAVLRRDTGTLQEHIDRGDEAKLVIEATKAEIKAKIFETVQKTQRVTKVKETKDQELRKLQERIDSLHTTVADKQSELRSADVTLSTLQKTLKTKTTETERFLQNYNTLHKQTLKLTDALDAQIVTNQEIAAELNELEAKAAHDRTELRKVAADSKKTKQLSELTLDKIKACDDSIGDVEAEQARLAGEKAALRLKITSAERANQLEDHSIKDLAKESDILKRSVIKVADRSAQAETLVVLAGNTRKTLENEISGYRSDLRNLRDRMDDMHEEHAGLQDSIEGANQALYGVQEQVKLQEVHIRSLETRIQEGTAKHKQQVHMYESVRTDRNMYSKHLVEVESDIEHMSKNFKMLTYQIDQLKEEITNKDHSLVKEHFGHHKVEKEKDGVRTELTRVKRHVQTSEQIIVQQDKELNKLTRIVADADEERARQQKELGNVVGEKDVLRNQLIARDMELNTLYEKLKLQRSSLEQGASLFNRDKKSEAEIKDRVGELRKELTVSKQQVSSIDTLKAEVFKLNKDLLRERAKVSVLGDELERPLNVHRWRRLEGSNPKVYAMIVKVQNLQKRVIAAHSELSERQLLIRNKEGLYLELKEILARQPGPQVGEQLTLYQQTLKQKVKQLRAMKMELEMYKSNVADHKYAIAKATDELGALDKEFLRRAMSSGADRGGTPPPAVDYMSGNLWDGDDGGGGGGDGGDGGGDGGDGAGAMDYGVK